MAGEYAMEQTWTFFGHWENDRLVIEWVESGGRDDDRVDSGQWEQGLFASAASGLTVQAAEAALRDEYERG